MISTEYYDQLKKKNKKIEKLKADINKWQSNYQLLENELKKEKSECKRLRNNHAPLQNTINNLTAERGKWLRKIKRLENK